MKPIIVLYHSNCPDGFGAAWAAWKKFGNKAEYIAIDPNELPNIPLKSKDIYILDNCFFSEVLEKLERSNKKVVVIDHHKSNEEHAKSATFFVFNINHSGAVLSWIYFHPGKKIPELMKYVEDVDLWRFKLPRVHEITTYTYAQEFDFKIWNKIAKDLETKSGQNHYVRIGKIIGRYEDMLIKSVLKKAELVKFGKYKVLAVNSPIKKFTSFLGHELVAKKPPLGIVWYETQGDLHVSLRGNGEIDVSKIAEKYGGGGHKNSAGFEFPTKKGFPWKIIKS